MADGSALLETAIPFDPVAANDERAIEVALLLSGAYLAMGYLERTRALSERMLVAAESTGDEVPAILHIVILAGVEYLQGDWAHGRDLLRRGLERARAIGPSALMIRAAVIVGRSLIWEDRLEDARSYLESSVETSRAMQAHTSERAALTELADLDLLEGHPDAALNRLLPLLKEELSWEYVVTLFSTLAAVYLELGDLQSARPHAQRAVAEARRTAAWVHGVRALEICARVEALGGDSGAARAGLAEGLQRAHATCPSRMPRPGSCMPTPGSISGKATWPRPRRSVRRPWPSLSDWAPRGMRTKSGKRRPNRHHGAATSDSHDEWAARGYGGYWRGSRSPGRRRSQHRPHHLS